MKKQTIASLAAIGAVGVAGFFGSQNTFAKVAVNTAFEDERFYQCVVTAYNNKEGESKDYQTDILTDAELLKITSLDCSKDSSVEESEKIASVSGLEKLTNLTSMNLKYNQIENIDLSKNTKLVEINLQQNRINSLDISKNTELQILRLEQAYLTSEDPNDVSELDITHNPKLEQILAKDTMLINNIQLTKNNDSYTLDLSPLKFVTNGSAHVKTLLVTGYSYDANNFIVTITDIQKVSYIELNVSPSDAMADTWVKFAVDKSGLANNNQTNEENDDEEVEVPNTSTTEQDNTNTETPTKKSTSPKTPETGDSTNNNDAIKSLPIIMLAVSATAFLMYRISKIITRKRVRF